MSSSYPVYFINLDKHVQRRAFMEAQFDHLGLPLIRMPGALGEDPEVRRHAALAWYASLTHGQIGCFESHRRFWKRVLDEGLPGALVLEDDVAVASDFGRWRFPASVLETCDIIKIDQSRQVCCYGTQAVSLSEERALRRYLGTEFATGCYFVTNKGAEKLYRASRKYFLPVDRFMFDQDSKTLWSLEVWKLDRAAAVQYRHYMPDNMISGEMEDSISSNKTHGRDLEPGLDRWRLAMTRVRRLLDWDMRRVREARKARGLAAFEETEPTETRRIDFYTATRDHIEAAEEFLKHEPGP